MRHTQYMDKTAILCGKTPNPGYLAIHSDQTQVEL